MTEKPLKEITRAGQWKPGQSGNPSGRPTGARNKFSENFVSDVAATWASHGASILEKMATSEPARFAELCGRLIPRDVSVSLQTRLPGGLEAFEWELALEVLSAIKEHLPDAGDRPPGEVMSHTLAALRHYEAKLIEADSSNTAQHDE